MREIELNVETITPTFIAGANQRYLKNEGLRAPSLRGLMRWWFRAIMGGMVPLVNLKKQEAVIFGSTENRSRIQVASVPMSREKPIHRSDNPNLRYLWFSIFMQHSRGQRMECYPHGSKFKIILRAKNKNEREFKIALASLWAMIYIGGLGSRMRRGAGCLNILGIRGNNLPFKFVFEGTTLSDARSFISRNLEEIFREFKQFAGEHYDSPNLTFSCIFSKNTAKLSLLNRIYDTFEAGLDEISENYQIYRRNVALRNRYPFGMPIIDRRRRIREFEDQRQASPFFIGVMKVGERYVIRLVKFYTSIHKNYSDNVEWVKRHLKKLNNELEEIEIPIPEVGGH